MTRTILNMVTVPDKMVRLERMSDYRGVRLERFHCTLYCLVIFGKKTGKICENFVS